MLRKRRRNGRGNCHHGKQRSGRFLPFAAIGAGETRFSLPSKFLLCPVGSLRQASVPRIAHAGFPFGARKNALNFLFCPFVHVPVFRCGPEILRHLHIALPGMAHDCLFALGILCTSGGPCTNRFGSCIPGGFRRWCRNRAGTDIRDRSHRRKLHRKHRHITGDCRLLPWAGLWRKPSSVVSGISVWRSAFPDRRTFCGYSREESSDSLRSSPCTMIFRISAKTLGRCSIYEQPFFLSVDGEWPKNFT